MLSISKHGEAEIGTERSKQLEARRRPEEVARELGVSEEHGLRTGDGG